uniref:Uncharacterized protein ycf18 n=2 Tax=Membranoptera TaxID=158697 RepID=A0A1L1YA43_9FLOR|nr:phycobilisome degradation protein [Membranoptera weeksiae]YP_009332965.1 phycobilisome degradation protein [Membranoptera tenuis]AHZ94759.1 phycobilisome degradation protein [Membranoptera weeksiae]AKL79221.1 phycobilisome degradation protein [Membranoptera tenuis]
MDNINKLKLEQEFQLTIYKQKIYKLNQKTAKQYLKNILKQMMIKDNIIKYYIKNSIN